MKNGEHFNWCGYDWYTYSHIKNDTANYKEAYFEPEAVKLENGILHLGIVKGEKHFDGTTPYPVRHYGVGEVISGTKFSYGEYTWEAKMPFGTHLWPALWLCGATHWPPEIDAVEGYTDDETTYVKNMFVTTLENNVHYEENGKHVNIKGKGMASVIYKLYHKSWDEWKVRWDRKCIKIYFNGVVIRTIRNKNVINYFNKYPSMDAIMNMMILENFDENDYQRYGKQSELLVRRFTYRPL